MVKYKGYEIHILADTKHTVTVTIIKGLTVIAKWIVDTRVKNPIDSATEYIDSILG